MNVKDTAAVVAYFGSAWPKFEPSDDTVDVWVAELHDIDPLDGFEAMRNLVKSSRFVPSIAEFRVECRTVALRRQQSRPLALTAGGSDVPTELLEELRKVARQDKKHWHGGPDPCPTCGGMKPAANPYPAVNGTQGA